MLLYCLMIQVFSRFCYTEFPFLALKAVNSVTRVTNCKFLIIIVIVKIIKYYKLLIFCPQPILRLESYPSVNSDSELRLKPAWIFNRSLYLFLRRDLYLHRLESRLPFGLSRSLHYLTCYFSITFSHEQWLELHLESRGLVVGTCRE
jgi:hypothetical protein